MKQVTNPKNNIRIKNSDEMRRAFDVVAKTDGGKALVFEAKSIGQRVRDLRELSHSVIVEMLKSKEYKGLFHSVMIERCKTKKATVRNPYKLFIASKSVLKEIAVKGGDDYKSATETLQYACASEKNFTALVDQILE